jgi:hypothetical protein
MPNPDQAVEALRKIIPEFQAFLAQKGAVSESDTRAKLIDRVLTQVCCWPEGAIVREERVDRGCIDYSLAVQSRRYVAVEAKKADISFTSPTTTHKTLKLSGSLLTDRPIAEALGQVRGYCDDAGIRYAVATNGSAWIIFRAIREDMPWREGSARVFPDLEYIQEHFTDFWNLLSFDAIQAGSLDEEFGARRSSPRQLHRVVDRLFNSDLPLQRNRLHAQLHHIIESIFQDIAQQDSLEILQSCYVHTGSLLVVARDLNAVITDEIPEFLRKQGAEPVYQGPNTAGQFGSAIEEALTSRAGELYLLLGGIGSGKTTFVKRYQRAVGKELLDQRAFWFHLDFLKAPLDPLDMEPFAWQEVLYQLRSRYEEANLETRRNIQKAFADSIEVISQTVLTGHNTKPAGWFQDAISPYLEKWRTDVTDYVPRLLRVVKSDRRKHIVLFIDNVDQLTPAHQAQVFLLAQRITRIVGSVTILSLREESYYTANTQKTLTAYTNRKFHIASPRFRKMISSRIQFAMDLLNGPAETASTPIHAQIPIDRPAIADFLSIIKTSIFEVNYNIARLVEALCFGNMRLALDWFTTFMTSGATDVDKMLGIYRRTGAYYVAFHEFVKSIMLGERRYYKDEASPILNVFDCSGGRNASHFTSLRIIRALSAHRGEATREGQGYVEITQLIGMSEDVFDNREDTVRSLNRMVARQVIEANTKSTDSITDASHVRITSSGWYYARYLVNSFAYLDLVLQDTPLDDLDVEQYLRKAVYRVDNLSDSEEQKVARMQVRFGRVRKVLEYLADQERAEQRQFDLERRGGIWVEPFVLRIAERIGEEIAWIERRVKENRERFAEEVSMRTEIDELDQLDVTERDDDETTERNRV